MKLITLMMKTYESMINQNDQECETEIFIMLRKNSVLFYTIYMITAIVKFVVARKREKSKDFEDRFLGFHSSSTMWYLCDSGQVL